jgi:hypothetical protein
MAVFSMKEPKIIVPSQIVELRKQEGKRIVQMWLADDSFTFNNRRLNKEALPDIAKTILTKKYLIPPDLNHPQRKQVFPNDMEKDIASIHEAGRPYEAGTVYDLERHNREGRDGWDAFIEMDTPVGIRLFDAGILPRYSSTSIYKVDNNEPEDDVRNAIINNICAVKYPNYGIKASIQGMCVGDPAECKDNLLNNSAVDAVNELQNAIDKMKPCPTMKAINELDDDNKIVFSIDNEIQSGINMSAQVQPNVGTTDATVEYNFPKSGRKITLDGKGNIMSDTHPKETIPNEVVTKQETIKKIETEPPKGEEETKPEGSGEGAKKAVTTEESKTVAETEKKTEKESTPNDDTKKDTQDHAANVQQNNELENLKGELKKLSSKVDKSDNHMKYYRKQLITAKVNSANLKPEQKEQHVKRWNDMDIHGEELDFALNTAYGEQSPIQKVPDKEKKNSAYIVDDNEQQNSTTSRENTNKPKITMDMLSTKKVN